MKAFRISSVVLLAATFVAAPAARAAVDAFIWFENAGIAGESKDPKHMGWIEVSSFQLQQIQNQSSMGSAAGGAGAGKVSFHEFQISKLTDKASPKLMQAAATGKHFPTVVIEMRKAGGDQHQYLEIKLENVLVSSYHAGGAGGGGPQESMTLSFAKMTMKNSPESPRAGAALQVAPGAAAGALVTIPNAITKVTASAASATPGQSLTFLIEGTGACVRSRIDFGDGTVVEFPFTAGKSQPAPTHSYSKGGSFEVRAYGLADPWAKLPAPPPPSERVCSGHAFTNVSVRAAMALAPAGRK